MIGQGRPFRCRRFDAARAWPGWRAVCGLAMALWFTATATMAAESTLRLRVAWGGGAEHQWHGQLRVSAGKLSELEPLGIDADEPGSVWIGTDQGADVIYVRERAPRAYDGFDILVTAEPDAKLSIELKAVDEEPAVSDDRRPAEVPTRSVEFSLSEVLADAHKTRIDSTGNRLLVMRSPGDRLRVRFDRPHLVFARGEEFPLEVTPHLLGLEPGTPIRVKTQLTVAHRPDGAARDKLWHQEYDTTTVGPGEVAESRLLPVKLPEAEGVYDLTIAAIDLRLMERVPWKNPLASRTVQLVVVGEKSPYEGQPESAMKLLQEIDPANPRWHERLTNLTLWPGQRLGPLGSGEATRWEHRTLGAMIRLGGQRRPAKAAETGEAAWEAYPLPISNPGQPHILEIEYPSDVTQALGISIIEPNAAGAVMPIGLDSGVYVQAEDSSGPPVMRRHRLVFWPRSRSPLLLMTNQRQRTPAVYGRIRVLGSPPAQLSVLRLGQKVPTYNPLPKAPVAPVDGRKFYGYLDRPLFAENFSAPEAMDLFSKRSLDDWTTFYLGGQRLVEYLNHAGYNGLVMSVLADGSTIYPSELLEATPKHDTGVFFATGQDPVRKDVLELVLRMFDREGLKLTPALQFAAPLPELEAIKRDRPERATGIDLVGADGRTWVEKSGTRLGLAPYYNPLNPHVQQAMVAVVRELADRYHNHPAFDGIALQLTADGYAQLPGPDWGYDDDTVARFVRDTHLVDADADRLTAAGEKRYAVRAELLGGRLKPLWLDWRAEQIVLFHRKLQQAAGCKVLLLGATLFDGTTAQRSLRPTLPRRTRIDDVLLGLGLRPHAYDEASQLVFVRPYRGSQGSSQIARGVDSEINFSQDVTQLFAGIAGGAAALHYTEPLRSRLESFDVVSPFGQANTYTWLVSQLSPSADQNRRRFARSLAAHDVLWMADGGWLLPLGQEEALTEFVQAYRQLPAQPFETLATPSEPVTIRTLNRDGRTLAYLVNDSPWRVRLNLQVDAAGTVDVERLGSDQKLPPLVREGATRSRWTVDFEPYQLLAVRFSGSVQLSDPQVELDDAARVALARRIVDLRTRVASLANPPPLAILLNPGFEAEGSGGQIPGWIAAPAASTSITVDANEHRGGQYSLKLSSEGPRASVRSVPLDPPTTGRLSISLWMRTSDAARQPSVRLAVEARVDDAHYYRFAAVGGTGPNQVALGSQWAQYIYQVDDLPTEDVRDLRVRFDLTSAGEVWLDDVQVFDLAFTGGERIELSKMVSLAADKQSVGQYGGCLQLLESYWPQFLLAHVPLGQGAGPLARNPAPRRTPAATPATPAREETEEKKPGVIDRLKDFVPKLR